MFSHKRHAIGWALMVFFAVIFLVGIVWIVLYYGMIIPMQTRIGTSWSDPDTATFMSMAGLWWIFVILLGAIVWLWNRSNKTGLSY